MWETKYELKKYVLSLYNSSKLGIEKEKVLWIVKGIINGSIDYVVGCSELAMLRSYKRGYEYIPYHLVGIQSMIEDINYSYKDPLEKDKIMKLCKNDIISLSKNLYDNITKDKI